MLYTNTCKNSLPIIDIVYRSTPLGTAGNRIHGYKFIEIINLRLGLKSGPGDNILKRLLIS